jgi:hypothetical protein
VRFSAGGGWKVGQVGLRLSLGVQISGGTRALLLLATLLLTACATPQARRTDVLFWNQAQREAAFPAMETRYASNIVRHGVAHPLPAGASTTEARSKPIWPRITSPA